MPATAAVHPTPMPAPAPAVMPVEAIGVVNVAELCERLAEVDMAAPFDNDDVVSELVVGEIFDDVVLGKPSMVDKLADTAALSIDQKEGESFASASFASGVLTSPVRGLTYFVSDPSVQQESRGSCQQKTLVSHSISPTPPSTLSKYTLVPGNIGLVRHLHRR
jgi:hypothetical protein